MKNSIKAILVVAALSFMTPGNSFAQEIFANSVSKTAGISKSYVNDPIQSADENSITTASLALTNPALVTKFSTMFPAAIDVKWAQIENNFWVSFSNNGQKSTASFAPKASLNYLVTGCSPEQLPAAFSKAIKNDYNGYQLFNAIKIEAHDAVAYQVVLENATNYITLKYISKEVEEIQVVKKSPAR